MNKIEFSDLNKFLTSIGLIFIGIAFLFPWYINQSSDLIVLDQAKIDKSTKSAQNIIINQQNYLKFISDNSIGIVIALMVLGAIILAWGIVRWRKRQKVRDDKENEELNALKKQNISMQEKKEIIGEEIETEPSQSERSQIIQNYLNIENLIYLKISQFYTANYVNRQNIRIGKFDYDIIMESKFLQKRGDFIIEIKYIKPSDPLAKFIDSVNLFLISINQYEISQKRSVTPVIIFVAEGQFEEAEILERKERLRDYSSNLRDNLRVRFINENEIEAIEAPELLVNDI